MRRFIFIFALSILSLGSTLAQAKLVKYELNISRQAINLSGKKTVDFALTVNGGIPAPTLEFTEGDEAEIVVRNNLTNNEEVSIHWHGILLPPEEDGVAYVNTPPIFPGKSHTFRFKIRQHGTYWYHSHTGVQEQKGVYGALVIHPKEKNYTYDKDVVVVLSDWSDEDASQIMKNLRKDGDYYLYKKDSIRSWSGAIRAGGFLTYLKNEWARMGGMDLSDVGYDAFLINGKKQSQLLGAKPGERLRIRIINAGASSYFYVALGQAPMKIISADGVDIEPVRAHELLLGMAETYDVLYTVPDNKSYELRATVQDATGFASLWIGEGEKVYAPTKPLPDYYAPMDHGDHSEHGDSMSHGNHGSHEDHGSHIGHAMPTRDKSADTIQTLTVDHLKAVAPTTLPTEANVYELKLILGGDMERYVWHINGKAIHQDRNILIREGDVVRFIFENETMMHHPMHLHGHFFRVLNQFGDLSPLKHTVDVPPHGTRTIEFYANEPGQWMLHCHNLYHMKTGMARVVKYMSFKPSPEMERFDKLDPHLHDHWYFSGLAKAATNYGELSLKATQTWNEVALDLEALKPSTAAFKFEDDWEYEGDLFYKRWFNKYFNLTGGGSLHHEEAYGMVGFGYILPLLIETQVLLNHEGDLRLDLEKHFQWSKHLFSEVEFSWRPDWENEQNEDTEIEISLMYAPTRSWAAGAMLTNHSVGVGAQIRF